MKIYTMLSFLLVLLTSSAALAGNDLYWVGRLGDAPLTDGTIPSRSDTQSPVSPWRGAQPMFPYARLESDGEIYIAPPDDDPRARLANLDRIRDATVALRVRERADVLGRIFVPNADVDGMVRLQFTIEEETLSADGEEVFLRAKLAHYERLLDRDIPGAAWFRHQAKSTRDHLRALDADVESDDGVGAALRPPDPLQTYALLSGGRAISENLQLDRALAPTEPGEGTVDVNTIEGITIAEFDWRSAVEGLEPVTDPLAALIPDDQHALLLPDVAALARLMEVSGERPLPVLQLFDPTVADPRIADRYEGQLCLPLRDLASRLAEGNLIDSIAVTGSDPYFPTGTDVAVLMEASDAEALVSLLDQEIDRAITADDRVKRADGEIDGIAYSGARSPLREVSCYLAPVSGTAVVITNSTQQLQRIIDTSQGELDALLGSNEYIFFRDRYKRDDSVTATLFITDATIRRWCGPRWRIGTSRRARAAAFLAEIQASWFDRLVSGEAEPGALYLEEPSVNLGDLAMTAVGVVSERYGSLAFLTPILELDVDRVTEDEVQAYQRWLARYESDWRGSFDPIAVQFDIDRATLAADVTVMPLIANTRYGMLMNLSRGQSIEPGAGDPHEGTLLHVALSINRDSAPAQMARGWARGMAPQLRVDPLSWLGSAVALYVEDDPVWSEAREAEDNREFLQENFQRLPLALHFEVSSGMKLAAFLTALHAFVEQSAPGMTLWEPLEYDGQPYVRVAPTEAARAGDEELEDVAIYYAARPDALVLTPSEGLLKRALDRLTADADAGDDQQPTEDAAAEWLGQNLAVNASEGALEALAALYGREFQSYMQIIAWRALPILNEWKLRYPDRDPLELHERFWHLRLVCPAGGSYRWNEQWQTIESTVYGHPGEPRAGPPLPKLAEELEAIKGGLTFEDDGLRARMKLHRRPKSAVDQ